MSETVDRLSRAIADRYRLAREIGAGGMATVYLAHDLRHDRDVAIKVLHPDIAATLGSERFLSEIKTTAKLQHPHILQLLDSGRTADGGLLFYVMPFVEGESLRDRLEREKQLPVDEAVRIACEVASALHYAHRHGVIHRDIKPENILLHEGQALVADFGIALAVSAAGGSRMTQTGLSLGTPQYMSPEQAMGERTIDARADVYALGAMTYEMLAGEPPFTGTTVQAIVARIISEEPRKPSAQRKSVPPHVEAAVLRAIEKLPADRFADAASFAAAVGDEGRARPSLATPPLLAASELRRAVLPWTVAGVAIIAALLLAFGGSAPSARPLLSVSLLPPPGEELSERESFGAFSPDGRRFAFILQSQRGVARLWIRDLGGQDARVIAGTDGAEAPFWSPDGRSVGYFGHGRLMRIEAEGGSPKDLCRAERVGGGSWNKQGTIVFSVESEIRRVTATGGPCEKVLKAPEGEVARRPSMLPDGRHFLYTRILGLQHWMVMVGDTDGGTPTLLRDQAQDAAFVAPHFVTYGEQQPGSFLATVRAQRFDPRRLVLEGEPFRLTDAVRTASGIFAYAVSANGLLAYLPSLGDPGKLETDGRGVVIDTVRQRQTWTHRLAGGRHVVALGGQRLWLYDLDRNVSTLLHDTLSRNPVWSPGDSLLAYSAGCSLRLYRLRENRDSVVNQRVARCLMPSDWSRDGKSLILTQIPGDTVGQSEIWTYTLQTAALAPLITARANVAEGSLSPDGRWLAYQSDESGAPEVYVRAFRGQASSLRISTDGGRTPRWRADGHHIFFITPDGAVMSAAVNAGAELRTSAPVEKFRAPDWSRHLFGAMGGVPYDMSGDGTRFIFRRSSTATGAAAVLLENWPALMSPRE